MEVKTEIYAVVETDETKRGLIKGGEVKTHGYIVQIGEDQDNVRRAYVKRVVAADGGTSRLIASQEPTLVSTYNVAVVMAQTYVQQYSDAMDEPQICVPK